MRSPATNLFNTNGLQQIQTTRSSVSNCTSINYGKCNWYLTRVPVKQGYNDTSWKPTSVEVKRYYTARSGSTWYSSLVVSSETVYRTSSPSTDLPHHVSHSFTSSASGTTNSITTGITFGYGPKDFITVSVSGVTESGNSSVIMLDMQVPTANANFSFDFDVNYRTWSGNTITDKNLVTNITAVPGLTAYTWEEIYSPIATNEELMDDSGVVYDECRNRWHEDGTDNQACLYCDGYWVETEQDYYYCAPVCYVYDGSTYTRLFPVRSNASQSYVDAQDGGPQAIRYADIDFNADFNDPSGSW